SSAAGSADDQKVATTLENAGFTVTIIDDDVVQSSGDSVATGHDAVIISTSVAASKILDTFATTPVAVVTWEFLLFDDMALTAGGSTNRGEQGGLRSVDVVDPGHPIIDGAFTGITDVLTRSTKLTWGIPGPGADVVARQPGSTERSTLFVYEVGAPLVDGSIAVGRRAGIFLTLAADGVMNTAGETLLIETMNWATALPADPSGNQAPTANAGDDIDLESSGSIAVPLDGTATDDGLPEGSTLALAWSGPAGVSFDDPMIEDPTVTLPGPGTYTLTFSVSDGQFADVDQVVVDVDVPGGTPEILMVTTSSNGSTHDRIIRDVVVNAGYPVSIIDDDVVKSTGDSVADDADLVLISSTVSAFKVGSIFTNTPIPVLSYKSQLFDDLLLTASGSGNFGEQGSYTAVDVVDPDHPIIGGAFDGQTEILTSAAKVAWGVPGPEAQVAARRLNSSSRATLFTYDPGAALADGTLAPAARGALFLTNSADSRLNDNGRQLLTNAVAWALGTPVGPVNRTPVVDAGPDQVLSSIGPVTATLAGTVTDDGLPDGAAVTSQWTGPPEATITDPAATATTVDLPGPGTYDLVLTASDTERSDDDTVRITVTDPTNPARVLMVTTSSTGNTDDRAIKGYLEGAGFDVTIIDDNALTAASVTGYDAVLVTTTASASVIGTTLTGVPVPVVNYEFRLHDDLQLTGTGNSNRGELGGSKAIDIVDPTHPIAGGRSGLTDVFSAAGKVTWGKPAASARVVATQATNGTRAAIFTYDIGDPLFDGTPAPERRAGVFPAAATDGLLIETGQDLLVDTVAWAAERANRPPTVDAGPDRTVDAAQPLQLGITITDDPIPAGQDVTAQWSGPPEVQFSDATAIDPVITFTAPGVYELTVIANDGLATATDTVEVTAVVQVAPTASGTATPTSGDVPLLVDLDGSASSDPDGTIVSWEWDLGNGSFATGETATATYLTPGEFDVSLTVTDDLGATDTFEVGTITVVNGPGTGWVDDTRPYRFTVTVDGGAADRIDRPAELAVAFAQVVGGRGRSGHPDTPAGR
ncbi:MAG: PKD domain-containing protein, partial [Actinomycetota bacterium]